MKEQRQEKERQVNFWMKEVIYNRLKTVALSRKVSIKALMNEIITDYVRSISHEALIASVIALSPHERLVRIFEQQADENQ